MHTDIVLLCTYLRRTEIITEWLYLLLSRTDHQWIDNDCPFSIHYDNLHNHLLFKHRKLVLFIYIDVSSFCEKQKNETILS